MEPRAARFGWRALAPAFIDWLVKEFAGNEYARKDCFQVLLQISNAVPKEQENTAKELLTKKDERELSARNGQSQGDAETLRSKQERLAVSDEALAAIGSAVCSKWSEGSYGLTSLLPTSPGALWVGAVGARDRLPHRSKPEVFLIGDQGFLRGGASTASGRSDAQRLNRTAQGHIRERRFHGRGHLPKVVRQTGRSVAQ